MNFRGSEGIYVYVLCIGLFEQLILADMRSMTGIIFHTPRDGVGRFMK